MGLSTVFRKSGDDPADALVRKYGDLLFDLCQSVLWTPAVAQQEFRAVLKELVRGRDGAFAEHERAWVLRVACERLRVAARRNPRRITAAEQIELDASPGGSHRLRKFDGYFARLGVDDQLVLILRDKHQVPFAELASALGIPEGSLKIRRAHALRALEEWIWGGTSG